MAGPQPNGIFLARPEEPSEGKRLAVKDLFDTAGLTTTYGSIVYADHVPERSAEAVTRLEAAGLRERRQDEPARVRVRDHVGQPALRDGAEPARIRDAWPAGRAAARRRRSRPGSPSTRSAPTRAARSGSRPPAAGSSASSRATGSSRSTACFPLAPSFDHAGPMARSVGECEEMLQALADGFEPTTLDSLEELEVGVAWLDRADPLVQRARPRGGGAVPAAARDRLSARGADRPRLHARGRRRPPRPLRRVRRLLRRQRADEDRALPGA